MTIHSEHPFSGGPREQGKAFRGHLGARVALLSAGSGRERAGLTVSSLMVVGGDPWRLLAALDPESELTDAVERTQRAVVMLLGAPHRQLADAFAGMAPAPGGLFAHHEWDQTDHGPRLVGPSEPDTWAMLDLERTEDLGWSRLCTFRMAETRTGADADPLHHARGRYASR